MLLLFLLLLAVVGAVVVLHCYLFKHLHFYFTLQSVPRYWKLTTYAAKHGGLPLFIWARELGGAWTSNTCRIAAKNGHLEILKYAREHGCEWDSQTCSSAAGKGHLDVVKWARENGCPWSSRTCLRAAEGGHLEVLKWAREHGCDWGVHSYARISKTKIEVLEWARQNRCTWHFGKLWCAAALNGNVEILKWATENKVGYFSKEWPNLICGLAAKKGHLNVVIWGIEQGASWVNKEKWLAQAREGGHTNICDWIMMNDMSLERENDNQVCSREQ